ncbi:glycosyl transferase family 1, partial [Litorilinea aerophila]
MTHHPTQLAIFLPSLAGGGAERAMVNLAHGLADRGHAVDLVLARAAGPYLREVRPPVRVVDLQAPRVLASLPRLVYYLR